MTRVRVELHERDRLAVRCVLCHEVGGELVRCEGCSALTHAVCREEFTRGCPTIGCAPRGDLRTQRELVDERVSVYLRAEEARRLEGLAAVRARVVWEEVERERAALASEIPRPDVFTRAALGLLAKLVRAVLWLLS